MLRRSTYSLLIALCVLRPTLNTVLAQTSWEKSWSRLIGLVAPNGELPTENGIRHPLNPSAVGKAIEWDGIIARIADSTVLVTAVDVPAGQPKETYQAMLKLAAPQAGSNVAVGEKITFTGTIAMTFFFRARDPDKLIFVVNGAAFVRK